MHKTLFEQTGAHILVDGQFGSTGKGALAHWLATHPDADSKPWNLSVYSGGPNSGHTFYHNGEKHVLKQLPSFGVARYLLGEPVPIYLSAGAIIDPEILFAEIERYAGIRVIVNPNAAVVRPEDAESERSGSIAAVAGTRSGTGAALARKVMRSPDAVVGHWWDRDPRWHSLCAEMNSLWFGNSQGRFFVEVAQGFSLGLNSQFYPKVTSRECTVQQAIADARIPISSVSRVYMSIRAHPIRVGNVDGFDSGGWYPDQHEITWEGLGQTPELTTVTKRVRRIATFSWKQLIEAVRTNEPDFVFLNFLNYLSEDGRHGILYRMADEARRWGFDLITGKGPTDDDISMYRIAL